MDIKTIVLTYSLAAAASMCLAGGIAILTGGRVEKNGKTGVDHRVIR